MLFGDLGTSRLYVLGLAISYAGTSAPYHVAAVCVLLVLVGWAYTVACRVNPDGGGVYSAARAIHPNFGLVGATLLLTDFVVTAALSAYEAIAYIGAPFGIVADSPLIPWIAGLGILLLGVLNYVGPKRAGTFALAVAIAAIAATVLVAAACLKDLPIGWERISPPQGSATSIWSSFANVVLALSGIEAIANLTGIMAKPVVRTVRLSIWPVVGEVVLFNMILIIAAMAIPGLAALGTWATSAPEQVSATQHVVQERLLWLLAGTHLPGWLAATVSIIFGLLLLSASNTAILTTVNIQYSMARDRELPEWFAKINTFGVPWYGLFAACLLPIAVVMLVTSIHTLAAMYAIGMLGAITLNLWATAWNRQLDVKQLERIGLWVLGGVLFVLWLTIAWTRPTASGFLAAMLIGGIALRFVAKSLARRAPAVAPLPSAAAALSAAEQAELAPLVPFDPARRRILVATRGAPGLLKFAFEHARLLNANVFVLFVRELAVLYQGEGPPLTPDRDPDARGVFELSEQLARKNGVPLERIYSVSPNTADVILDVSATYAIDFVMLGASRRTGVMRALRGDVISGVAENLPAETTMLIHA